MPNNTISQPRYKIESQFDEPQSEKHPPIQRPGLIAAFKVIWQILSHYLLPNNEPKIWQKRDRYGNPFWVVYDPVSDRSQTCYSEQEVQIRLEQLPYR